MKRLSVIFFMSLWTIIVLTGCDAIPGMGNQEAQQPIAQPGVPPVAPMPGQPGVPPVAPMPGQPMAQPGVPLVPGQPMAQPGVMPATPLPGQPVVPGMPVVPGQPVAQPVAPPTPPTPTGDALTDLLNTTQFQMASDFAPTSALVKATLKKGKNQDYQVQLPGPPYCHAFIAVADDKVGNLDLALESPAGMVDAADTTQAKTATILNHCPTMPGLYKVKVTMPKDAGEFALQAFSK